MFENIVKLLFFFLGRCIFIYGDSMFMLILGFFSFFEICLVIDFKLVFSFTLYGSCYRGCDFFVGGKIEGGRERDFFRLFRAGVVVFRRLGFMFFLMLIS